MSERQFKSSLKPLPLNPTENHKPKQSSYENHRHLFALCKIKSCEILLNPNCLIFIVLSLLLDFSSYAKITTYGFNPMTEGQFGVNLVDEQHFKSLNMADL